MFSADGTQVKIFNPFYEENIKIEYVAEDDRTPFTVYFSFQHRHLKDEKDVIDYIKEIMEGKKFAIEFFQNNRKRFGGDIEAEQLYDLSYEKLEEQLLGHFSKTKLYEIADSFKVRGWSKDGNFDAFIERAHITKSV